MGKLGDAFPDSLKQDYARRHLRPGQVLCIHCWFTSPPKNKYLVVAAVSASPLPLLINSAISDFAQAHPHLLACQVRPEASEYRFLDHDSYIDCSNVRAELSNGELVEQIRADVSRVKGELTASIRAEIVRVIQGAKTVSRRHKQLIADALG